MEDDNEVREDEGLGSAFWTVVGSLGTVVVGAAILILLAAVMSLMAHL